ncbi:hypothetical protein GGR21_000978 [Dysgonomonas hofstadii]|uniref:SHOCT domain-containing protein n=1 Tax=Dysgonomonas hofstadii TaxID=637886 RepID=A0A840CK98_9BACT|nr:DUF4870 domain-containing protein [Dysgonomonas hofstadii]MBB4035089.1 hypothetical protein [Dysgonomonas hofstadii]
MDKYDDLRKLEELRERGVISEEEFQNEKQRILNSDNYYRKDIGGMSINTYLLLMHLSQFAGFIVPGLGFIAPIVMWVVNKENPEVDKHGKNIANFMISMIIYAIVSAILIILIIGIPMLIAIAVIELVFIIIAAVKAANGEYWKYPLAIQFFT